MRKVVCLRFVRHPTVSFTALLFLFIGSVTAGEPAQTLIDLLKIPQEEVAILKRTNSLTGLSAYHEFSYRIVNVKEDMGWLEKWSGMIEAMDANTFGDLSPFLILRDVPPYVMSLRARSLVAGRNDQIGVLTARLRQFAIGKRQNILLRLKPLLAAEMQITPDDCDFAKDVSRFLGYPLLTQADIIEVLGGREGWSKVAAFFVNIPPDQVHRRENWVGISWSRDQSKMIVQALAHEVDGRASFIAAYAVFAEYLNGRYGDTGDDVISWICGGNLTEYVRVLDKMIAKVPGNSGVVGLRKRLLARSVDLYKQLIVGRESAVGDSERAVGADVREVKRFIQSVQAKLPEREDELLLAIDQFFAVWPLIACSIDGYVPEPLGKKL